MNFTWFVSADLKALNADIIQGITNYLKSSLENVKFLGTYVGQFICNKINASSPSSKKLDLSCNEDGNDARNIAKEISDVISLFELVQVEAVYEFFGLDFSRVLDHSKSFHRILINYQPLWYFFKIPCKFLLLKKVKTSSFSLLHFCRNYVFFELFFKKAGWLFDFNVNTITLK